MSFTVIEGDVTVRSSTGVELSTENAVAVVANARGFISVGYDGTNTRFIRVDSSGYQVVVGSGTAGTPAGGVVSVQGVSGGQAVPISGSVTASGTVTATQGNAGTHAQRWMVGLSNGKSFISPATDRTTAASPFSVRLSDATAFLASATATPSGSERALVVRNIPQRPATATLSNVTAAATSTSILSSNTSRLGMSVFNDSDTNMYLKLGASASTTSFTAKLAPGQFYECPWAYTGAITAIWEASPTGAARVTEIT